VARNFDVVRRRLGYPNFHSFSGSALLGPTPYSHEGAGPRFPVASRPMRVLPEMKFSNRRFPPSGQCLSNPPGVKWFQNQAKSLSLRRVDDS
jgi:hypothetical protein